jgi:hypothetical protein
MVGVKSFMWDVVAQRILETFKEEIEKMSKRIYNKVLKVMCSRRENPRRTKLLQIERRRRS